MPDSIMHPWLSSQRNRGTSFSYLFSFGLCDDLLHVSRVPCERLLPAASICTRCESGISGHSSVAPRPWIYPQLAHYSSGVIGILGGDEERATDFSLASSYVASLLVPFHSPPCLHFFWTLMKKLHVPGRLPVSHKYFQLHEQKMTSKRYFFPDVREQERCVYQTLLYSLPERRIHKA